jgi:hypothetical protein
MSAFHLQALPGGQMRIVDERRNGAALPPLAVTLNLPGEHNVLNALGVCTLAEELDIEQRHLRNAFAAFEGVARRFEIKGERNGILFIDDYGHHPVEIAAVLRAARLFARNDRAGIARLYWQTAAWVAVLSFPILVLTTSLAPTVTGLLFGAKYRDSWVYLALVSFGYYFSAALGRRHD